MKVASLNLLLLLVLALPGCGNLNDPYAPSPYGSSYDRDYDRDEYYRNRDYDRKRDLRRERERLEEERERLERERREHREHNEWQRPPPPPRREEHCPSGFSPSERKCSTEERRHGCKDMRLPGGLGCVSR